VTHGYKSRLLHTNPCRHDEQDLPSGLGQTLADHYRMSLATPTAIELAGDTLWYGERASDLAHSMPLPK
jgi:hypothetical protein